MEDKYQKFSNFDWSDERWHSYLSGLYPPPNYKQVLKFKKKWYKKNVDSEFDETYEPSSSTGGNSSGSTGPTTATSGGDDGCRWAALGFKASLCFLIYSGGLGLSLGALLGVCHPSLAVATLTGSFIFELLMRHGVQFSKDYVQKLLQEDVGMMPMLSMAVYMPGTHRAVHVLALVPLGLTAMISFTQICKHHKVPGLPGFIESKITPIAEIGVRYQLMQARADAEVSLGFVLLVGLFAKLSSPVAPLLLWNFIWMRYTVSPWTQATFRKIDGILNPVLGRIPLVSTFYAKLKDLLYSFVSSDARRNASANCSIL